MDDQLQIQSERKSSTANLSVKELFFKYVRFLPLFILTVALSLLVAYLYLRYATPVYRSAGAILVKQSNNNGGGGAGADRFQQIFVLDNSISIQNEIEVIKSRPLMERVVEDLSLNTSYFSRGAIGETNLYTSSPIKLEILQLIDSNSAFDINIKIANEGGFYLEKNTNLTLFGQTFKTLSGTFRLVKTNRGPLAEQYIVNWQPTWAVAGALASDLAVAPKGTTGILLVSLEAKHPHLAANVVNQVMKQYQVATVEDKNETNRRMLSFIDERLKGVQREVDSVTGVLLAYQQSNNLINSETQASSYLSRMEETDREINDMRAQDNIAQMIGDYLSNRRNANDPVPSTLGLSDPTLGSMISGYNVAQLERKALIDANVPATNPRVQQKTDQIEHLRINILESLRNLRRSIQASIGRLNRTSNTVKFQVRSLPAKEQNLQEIKQQQATKQAVFNLLMEQREQTAITLAGTISNMKVVEPASVNTIPVSPNRRNVQILAIVIGLVIPALVIFALEALNDKVTTRHDIERITTVPIVGEIGHSFGKEALVVKANHRGIVAEQFRIIRSNLQYFLTHIQKPVIMITSSFSGEGKSFISTNLGAVMSLTNKRTIVLEFDIRKPKVLSHIGIPKKPGLTNYILGKIEKEQLPIPVEGYENLFVLACGPIPPNPSELLLDPKLDELFQYLKETFDLIIIDTAPIGMVSDAMALSRYADTTLYVVRQGHTFKKQVNLIDEFHTAGKLPKLSIIMNDVKVQSGYGYYGSSYGYGHTYGAGYFEEEKQPTFFKRWFGWLEIKKVKQKNKA